MEERIGSWNQALTSSASRAVLILIVMEERIGYYIKRTIQIATNPKSLNPYCNGRKNRIGQSCTPTEQAKAVLILIVMEERIGSGRAVLCKSSWRLNPYCNGRKNRMRCLVLK